MQKRFEIWQCVHLDGLAQSVRLSVAEGPFSSRSGSSSPDSKEVQLTQLCVQALHVLG